MRNTGAKNRSCQEDEDSAYLFGNSCSSLPFVQGLAREIGSTELAEVLRQYHLGQGFTRTIRFATFSTCDTASWADSSPVSTLSTFWKNAVDS